VSEPRCKARRLATLPSTSDLETCGHLSVDPFLFSLLYTLQSCYLAVPVRSTSRPVLLSLVGAGLLL